MYRYLFLSENDRIYTTACHKPPSFNDAVVDVVSGTHLKSVASYKCLPEYTLQGNPNLVCLANGRWSERQFKCLSK